MRAPRASSLGPPPPSPPPSSPSLSLTPGGASKPPKSKSRRRRRNSSQSPPPPSPPPASSSSSSSSGESSGSESRPSSSHRHARPALSAGDRGVSLNGPTATRVKDGDRGWDTRRRDPRANGADIYVARFTKNGMGSARPCWRCLEWCRWAGVKRIFHWNAEENRFEVVKVNSAQSGQYETHADIRLFAGLVRDLFLRCHFSCLRFSRVGSTADYLYR